MKEQFRRRRLPHWDVPGATYFVTACLEGSIPAQGLLELARHREELSRRCKPDNLSDADWKRHCWKLAFAESEKWLDSEPAARHLADRSLAAIVTDALNHFAETRYDLIAYVVMPSHFHWVFAPLRQYESSLPVDKSAREMIMQSIKRYSAYQCNKHLHRTGSFWQSESYDHCIVEEAELQRIVDYVELNPVKAGLAKSREEWEFSSAHDRMLRGSSVSGPLLGPRPVGQIF
ncbi:MAG: REP-associated tyrosine transposase [Planctomycetales bacterium]